MMRECSPKEQAIYDAVFSLFWEGRDLTSLTVSEITGKAGIGKGTAYEYFSDKEEMIAKALFFSVAEFCGRIYEMAAKEQDFYHKIFRILSCLEDEVEGSSCIFRLVHTLTDNSAVGKRLHEMMESKTEDVIMVEDVMRLTIMEEYRGTKIEEEKLFYLVTSTISRILCYAIILNSPCQKQEYNKESLRKMVCENIVREVQEILGMAN